ncbi:hypothetical protein [Dactylosporangium salmoneum]|uniref:Uncharacterized protein n=1 Tax=Dactylosporangium salmoneum TaxID=53361 RepID=A0ABN3G8J8_9ACTN
MIVASVPAFLTFGARVVPHSALRFDGHTVALVHRPERPCIARIVGTTFNFGVTVHGLAEGLARGHVEPSGRITISPSANDCGYLWVVVDIDTNGGGSQVWLDAEKVGEFLVDISLSRLLSPSTDAEHDWTLPRRRAEGGAS